MNNQFDELTKCMAQSVTRRAAIKKFGMGLAGMALACIGLASKAQGQTTHNCQSNKDCAQYGDSYVCCQSVYGVKGCTPKTSCPKGKIRWV